MAQDPMKPKDSGKIGLPTVDNAMNKLGPELRKGNRGAKRKAKEESPDEKILLRAMKRFDRCVKAEADNRKMASEDLKFLNGDQWPADVQAIRQADRRPCITVNKLKTFVHQVTNEQRQNRPSINLSPNGDGTDVKAAKMYGGLIRAIERESDAEIAYDTGFFNAAANGYGYWRVSTKYVADDSFDQIPHIDRIRNPFTVYLDPDCMQPEGSDATFGFVSEMIPKEEFGAKYPEARPVPWNQAGIGERYSTWVDKDHVRIAEYYEVETEYSRLVYLDNGHIGFYDNLSDETKSAIANGHIVIERERQAERKKTMWYKMTCLEILERTEVPTDGYIPIVRCVGDEIDVQGKVTFAGIVRDAKDAQRMYNYWRTTEAELVALQPKAPFVMEEGQVEGHEAAWNQANTKSMPYLLYKGTSVAGTPAPPPSRQAMGMAPQGVLEAIQGAAQDMQATTGIRFDATLAERQYDESGKALHELRRSGDVGSFHYIDNFARALKYTGHLLIVMIPKVLDTPRIMNILREDGTEQMIRIDPSAGKAMMMGQNAQGQQLPIFNPSVGKYGVTVTVGPSYATKRIEASEQMADFMAKMPNAAPLIADLYAKVQDWPMAQEIAARLAKTIPPNILMPDPDNMTPEVAAKIQAMMNQIQQMTMERQQLMKQLQDQTADRMILNSKYEKDFAAKMAKIQTDYETKVMDIAQKMETALAKLDHQQRKDVADTTMQIMDRMNTSQETVPATNTGQNPLE